jgi:alanine-glyoxylate transaminase/(R)-3-amino-2-methylpropionate-pyruvate transaminase
MEQGRQESHKKQLRSQFPSIATNHSEPLMLVRGTGLHLYDAEGREYLGFPGGNPVSACAAKATTDWIEWEGLPENARAVGRHLRESLEALQGKHLMIGDVRGMELMQALELVRDCKTKQPATLEVRRLMDLAKDNGLILGKGGLYGNVIRISPALTCTRRDVDDAIRLPDLSLDQLRQA